MHNEVKKVNTETICADIRKIELECAEITAARNLKRPILVDASRIKIINVSVFSINNVVVLWSTYNTI
jgi:hypothetical protein